MGCMFATMPPVYNADQALSRVAWRRYGEIMKACFPSFPKLLPHRGGDKETTAVLFKTRTFLYDDFWRSLKYPQHLKKKWRSWRIAFISITSAGWVQQMLRVKRKDDQALWDAVSQSELCCKLYDDIYKQNSNHRSGHETPCRFVLLPSQEVERKNLKYGKDLKTSIQLRPIPQSRRNKGTN